MNILIDKSILTELNCKGHFLVGHKTMVYLIMNGILRFNEPQCFQHRGEGMYLKSSFTTDHSHAESLTFSTCSFKLLQTLTGSCGQQGTATRKQPLLEAACRRHYCCFHNTCSWLITRQANHRGDSMTHTPPPQTKTQLVC